MLLTKTAKVTWQRPNCTHFKKLGYKFTKIGDEFEVRIEDLTKGSHANVQIFCDYCLEEGRETITEKSYKQYLFENKTIQKDACGECKQKKRKDVNIKTIGTESHLSLSEIRDKIKNTNLEKFGCENVFANEDIKNKIKQHNIDNYGVEYYTQTQECQDKIRKTTIDKYGTDTYSQTSECKEKIKITNLEKYNAEYYSQTQEYREKVKETCLDKFGVQSYSQTDEHKNRVKVTCLEKYGFESSAQSQIVKEKVKVTNLKKWGYEYPMQNPEFLEKQKIKILKAMKEKGTANYSSQQKHICELLCGELNYLLDNCFLDIALPSDMIYVEYNGSGHDIQVRIGKITEQQFKIKELRRYGFVKSQGWKEIELISRRDYLPSDEEILKAINIAKEKLNNGCNWVKFDIDKGLMMVKNMTIEYNFGELKKLNKTS